MCVINCLLFYMKNNIYKFISAIDLIIICNICVINITIISVIEFIKFIRIIIIHLSLYEYDRIMFCLNSFIIINSNYKYFQLFIMNSYNITIYYNIQYLQ